MMKAKTSSYLVSPLLQKIFIVLAIGAYIAQLTSMWTIALNVYSGGWRLSQVVWVILSTTILPLVLFAIAYFSTRNKKPLLWRVFESSFFVTIGLLLQTIVTQLMMAAVDAMMKATNMWFGDLIIWYEVVPLVVTMLVYIGIITWSRRSKTTPVGFTPSLQRIYTLLFGGAMVALIGMTVYHMILQYPFNSNYSSYLLSAVQMILLPTALFTAAFVTGPRKSPMLTRIFDALLYTAMGFLLYTIIAGIVRYFDTYFISPQAGYWPWVTYGLGVIAATLIVYIIAVVYIRRRR
jgi:hypothetical protein